ncbi:tyrosinase family protein [Iningainema tapete]|nr:tyrosinase family protein [Iningainema tapete]
MSYNVEQASHQILKDSYSSHQANSVLAPTNNNLLISKKIPASRIKVRKNVVDLTAQEKYAFIDAIRTLKNTVPEGSNINIYDQFVAVHVAAMGLMYEAAQGPAAGHDGAHESDVFLPWHREFIYRFEKALQSVNPNVTIPYWDWTDPKALEVIFADDFMGPNGQGVTLNIPDFGNAPNGSMMSGFDGQGAPNFPDFGNAPSGSMMSGFDGQAAPNLPVVSVQGGPVQSGPFSAANGWILNPTLHVKTTGEPFGEVLLRFMQVPPTNTYPVPREDVEQLLTIDDYKNFRLALEGFIKLDSSTQQPTPGVFQHNYFHSFVGGATFDPAVGRPEPLGTMGALASSINDPVFWLIHSNVDRLWAEWQVNGHAGSDYYPAEGGHYGENLNDRLWPWDGGESTPANWVQGDLLSLVPAFSPDDIVTPKDTLKFRKYGYTYDTFNGAAKTST